MTDSQIMARALALLRDRKLLLTLTDARLPLVSTLKPGDEATQSFRVVLHQAMRPGEWVTHLRNEGGNDTDQGFYWGHYCPSYELALLDYLQRCQQYGVNP